METSQKQRYMWNMQNDDCYVWKQMLVPAANRGRVAYAVHRADPMICRTRLARLSANFHANDLPTHDFRACRTLIAILLKRPERIKPHLLVKSTKERNDGTSKEKQEDHR